MRGTCLCGTLVFEIQGPLPALYQCHCTLCRRQTGAAANAATIVPAGQFRWLHGADSVRSWVKDTGFRSDFCATCGSPAPNPLRNSPYYWIPAGLLDDADQGTVAVHLHLGSRAAWETPPTDCKHYDGMPDLDQLLQDIGVRPGIG